MTDYVCGKQPPQSWRRESNPRNLTARILQTRCTNQQCSPGKLLDYEAPPILFGFRWLSHSVRPHRALLLGYSHSLLYRTCAGSRTLFWMVLETVCLPVGSHIGCPRSPEADVTGIGSRIPRFYTIRLDLSTPQIYGASVGGASVGGASVGGASVGAAGRAAWSWAVSASSWLSSDGDAPAAT